MGSWGQGARSALPMVGEVFQQALRNRWIDQQAEFDIPRPRPKPKVEPDQGVQWPAPREVFKGIMDQLRGIFR
jgi:penicillin-binding protein 1A